MIKTLIVPCVTTRKNVEFAIDEEMCCINCVRAISNIDIDNIDEVYFIILSEMDNEYRLTEKITADFSRFEGYKGKMQVIRLNKMTASSAETIYKALQVIGTDDRTIFIKDADNMCMNKLPLKDNEVYCASLENIDKVDPMHKSYIKLDEQGFITNAIEKRVISDRFIAGGYSFNYASDYIEAYDALKNITDKFYISDILFWLILNKNAKFMPVNAKDFKDFNI